MEDDVETFSQEWENLTFSNNFMFCKILESEPELCRQILELLLHIEIDHLESPQMEKTVQTAFESKSVRFDVYLKDKDRIFDLEMQTTNRKNLPKRARYYQSIIDVDNLSRGMPYRSLKDSYVIFLCLYDCFGAGLPVYFFENICYSDKKSDDCSPFIKLNDRTYKVFFNASKCDKLLNDEERAFFKFLKGNHAESALTKQLEEKLVKAKRNSGWRRQYMTWQQSIDEEAEIRAEILAEKKAEVKAEVLAEEKAKVLAEEKAKVLAEEKAKVLAEEKAKVLAEEKAKVLAEEKIKVLIEEKLNGLTEEITEKMTESFHQKSLLTAQKLIQQKNMSLEQIAEVLDLPIAEVRALETAV